MKKSKRVSYTEVSFRVQPLEPWRDILITELGALGYESFEEDMDGFKAFVPTEQFDRKALRSLTAPNDSITTVDWNVREVPDENWNAVWEEAFQPVVIGNKVMIRAEHHKPLKDIEHDIVIQPRMAFGTGHHATTSMMVQALLSVNVKGGTVCDLGCGTAVLAVLAERLGAASVVAIDNDDNAVENSMDNCTRNACENVAVEKGVVDSIRDRSFDLILANIERNTLTSGMATMAAALKKGGRLFLSGFILKDAEHMKDVAVEHGLEPYYYTEEGEWALVGCKK